MGKLMDMLTQTMEDDKGLFEVEQETRVGEGFKDSLDKKRYDFGDDVSLFDMTDYSSVPKGFDYKHYLDYVKDLFKGQEDSNTDGRAYPGYEGLDPQHKKDMMESYLYAMQKRREKQQNPSSEMAEEFYGRSPSEKNDGGYLTADDFRVHGMAASRIPNTPLRGLGETDKTTQEIMNPGIPMREYAHPGDGNPFYNRGKEIKRGADFDPRIESVGY